MLCGLALTALCFGATAAWAAQPDLEQAKKEQARLEQMRKELTEPVLARPAPDRPQKANVVYGATGQRREQPLTLGDDGRVSVSVSRKKAPESRLEPAYTPFSSEENAGVHMDVDLAPDLRLQVGGEHHTIETRDARPGAARGAAVSLHWNF